MDKDTRKAIAEATQRARKLLTEDFFAQLEGDFDIHQDGTISAKAGKHLSARQSFARDRIISAIDHKRAVGLAPADAVGDFVRDGAFTTLNRFVALKMLEARDLLQECITKGEQSAGYREYCGMAPGLALLPNSAGYRVYIESLFDELTTEIRVLFDRRDPSSALWPKRATFEKLLNILNAPELVAVWAEDETIGWVYQFFNGEEDRRAARYDKNGKPKPPQNSRDLAVRNQFFTPRYVVQFLTDNTLGRIWYEMRGTKTALSDRCEYMVRKPGEELPPREKKDPRDIRILDPACGSGHFLLYAFDLLIVIYEEAFNDPTSPASEATGKSLSRDYSRLEDLRAALPGLILAHNLHGVDIDPRCAQIAQLALWMRAQRAYSDMGISRSARSPIRRSNIVIAEPLVADERIAKEFVATLDDPELAGVFMKLVESLSLAGDMGLLLRVEKLIAPARKQGDLFAPPEDRIRAVLDRFMRDDATVANTRRRLFAGDAAHGLGLLRLAETKYDVVLMNPPFGESCADAASVFAKADCGNFYSAFVRRAAELNAEAIGMLTDRSFVTQASFRPYREWLLTSELRLNLLADLGAGVLDANVQTCAYVLCKGSSSALCTDARSHDEKATAIAPHSIWTHVSHESLSRLPDSVLAFALPRPVLQCVAEWRSLSDIASLPRGLGSNKAERTYLAWMETAIPTHGPGRWESLTNGGDFSPWWREEHGIADWRTPDGRCWAEMLGSGPKVLKPYDQSPSPDYFQPGLSYPKQSSLFNVSILPMGIIPTREGKAILPHITTDSWWLIAYLNSSAVRAFVRDTCGLHKQSGAIGRIPIPPFSADDKALLSVSAQAITAYASRQWLREETSRRFVTPFAHGTHDREDANAHLSTVDRVVSRVFGLADSESCWLEGAIPVPPYATSKHAVASWLIGATFGRFDPRLATGARALPPEPDPFDPLPSRSPGMYPEGEAPYAARDILVDDEGHTLDLAGGVQQVADQVNIAIADSLRDWLAKEFFPFHIKMYTRSRRKAPIYWQLATPSASYSVWLYIHAFDRDTLFRVQNDFVAPKLAHEERKLHTLASELREGATAARREAFAGQEAFVVELRTTLEEVRRVAALWNPDLDDGVIINFAPLWRLVPHHKPWQNELKTTWDSLCEGRYDWAQLAMHLWPERVVPKCMIDRSLAIAHGLEDVFWFEDDKGKWRARPEPTRSVEDVVQERSSPAVKAALKSLLEAPVASGKSKKPKKGSRNA